MEDHLMTLAAPVGEETWIRDRIEEHVAVARSLEGMTAEIAQAAGLVASTLAAGGKLLLCGNGGSAADAQHIAAEFTGRFLKERQALPALALHTNTSALTAIGNDYSFDQVFARQVAAFGAPGDLLIGISTSGNSANVLNAAREAASRGMKVVGFTGLGGGALEDLCDVCLRAPTDSTPRIQEMHIFMGHLICEIAEEAVC